MGAGTGRPKQPKLLPISLLDLLATFGMQFKTFLQRNQRSSFSIINLFYNMEFQEIYTNIITPFLLFH